ncbi:uncharacterized protein IAS62_001376 [Cryptococcus decagattii]|uniref:Uncharacterized protein n=1 Tax=Cryptococcus decagattii TaxID=1859122 RepID=A0ABZ2ASA9_9TREE
MSHPPPSANSLHERAYSHGTDSGSSGSRYSNADYSTPIADTQSSSISIAQLTELLGGAIDEIGLIDSRDTPPPTVSEPSKLEAKANGLEPATKVVSDAPIASISTLKSHKSAGRRALAYARAIHEIACTETGLKEWCAAAAHHSPSPSPFEYTPHPRNVSTGSEFPMRADSYTAREISQRVMDPADQPTALPPNLPYPQLQLQLQLHAQSNPNHIQPQPLLSFPRRAGGLKPSQSMQSVSSFTSISNIRNIRKTQSRSGSGPHTPRTVASPMGPRPLGQRGTFAGNLPPLPGRASLDTGLSRITSSPPPAATSTPPPAAAKDDNNDNSGEDVMYMADVLPFVEKSILRGYLKTHGGDQMRALGAYLEDERNGAVR